MLLKGFLIFKFFYGSVTPLSSQRAYHRLIKEVEAISLLGCQTRRFVVVKDDESLAFRLEVGLGYDVDDFAKLGKDGAQSLLERIGLDALLEVADIDAVKNQARGSRLAWDLTTTLGNLRRVGVQ